MLSLQNIDENQRANLAYCLVTAICVICNISCVALSTMLIVHLNTCPEELIPYVMHHQV